MQLVLAFSANATGRWTPTAFISLWKARVICSVDLHAAEPQAAQLTDLVWMCLCQGIADSPWMTRNLWEALRKLTMVFGEAPVCIWPSNF